MDEEELKKESKLGLKKQEMPKAPAASVDNASYDYINMNPQTMATCLPMNTEVMFYMRKRLKIFRKKKLRSMFYLIFHLQLNYLKWMKRI